jgi:5-methylcytosine-specific restriction endonuclease McrA
VARESRLTPRRRRNFWAKWGRRGCHYCGRSISRNVFWDADNRATIDHVVPLSLGGRDAQTNLVGACRPCNLKKGASVGVAA